VLLLAFIFVNSIRLFGKLCYETSQQAFLMFSSDYNVLRSTVIALNNFIQYIDGRIVQLFPFLTPLLTKAFTTIIPKHIVCPCVRFQTKVQASNSLN